jgi:AcrR family transcriptional regulator
VPVEVGARRNALKARSRNGGVSPRVHIAEMQRARLLSAAVLVIEEQGWAGASVAHITARARVSRRTFYDLYANREECMLAVLQDVVERIAGEIAAASPARAEWRERVRGGLLAILSFFDREPALARLCVVQALHGGPRVLEWREGVLAQLAEVLEEGRREGPRSGDCTALTAEGLVGAVFAILYGRLSSPRRPQPLRNLLGELMSLIVLPYLGPDAARDEQRRSLPYPPMGRAARESDRRGAATEDDPLREVPMRVTYRTALVLQSAAEHPGASNRIIGELADVHDQGQISKLLGRLQRIGLLANTGVGHTKGEPNAWRLTPLGERVTQQLSLDASTQDAPHEANHAR